MEQKFIKKVSTAFGSKYNFPLPKPTVCPHCGISTDGTGIEYKTFPNDENSVYGVAIYGCTSCLKLYLVVYLLNTIERTTKFIGIYPNPKATYTNDRVAKLSPRFISLYNQSLLAADSGCKDIAIIGFRTALEVLIKDYLIVEEQQDEKKISSLHLDDAISRLNQASLINAADVVRFLGNDATHYEKNYENLGYDEAKAYAELFIQQIEGMLMLKYPVVTRKSR